MKDKYLLSLAHIIFLLGLGAYTTQVLVSEKSKNKKAEKLRFSIWRSFSDVRRKRSELFTMYAFLDVVETCTIDGVL